MAGKKNRSRNSPAKSAQVVHAHAAGIDVGSESHVVAVPSDRDDQPEAQKRVQNHRNSPSAFDGEALVFKMTGVRLTDVDGLGASTVH